MSNPTPNATRNPALVLLHGAVLNGRMWDPIVADLSSDFQILTPDLPGHGTRAGEPFRLASAVAVVQDAVRSLAPKPVVLAGDSLGGYVSIAAAGSLGSQLQGAVLGGCTGNFQGSVAYVALIALTGLVPPARLQAQLEKRLVRDYAAGPAILQGGIRPAAFSEGVAEFRQVNFRTQLARLNIPILLVNGTRDWWHRLGERGTMAAAPQVTLHHIPGIGHGVSIIRPAEFAALIREFVTTRRLGSPHDGPS